MDIDLKIPKFTSLRGSAESFTKKKRKRESIWRRANKKAVKAMRKRYYAANAAKITAKIALRKAAKIKASPTWANQFFISEAYDLARLRTKFTGYKWHVDHIVPLKSELVCGLHAHTNIQVITASENFKKHNRYWPDMPKKPNATV